MSAKYFDQYDIEITIDQANASEIYIKKILENNEPAKEEYYEHGKLKCLWHYLKANESEAIIRQEYPGVGLAFYKERVVNGNYIKYLVEDVDATGVVTHRRIQVYLHDNVVYDRALDVITHETIYWDKQFYDELNDVTYEFLYDNLSGDFKWLTIYDPTYHFDNDNTVLSPDEIGNNPFNFSWSGFEYYQHGDPLFPSLIV